jgi:hypothetical protein
VLNVTTEFITFLDEDFELDPSISMALGQGESIGLS